MLCLRILRPSEKGIKQFFSCLVAHFYLFAYVLGFFLFVLFFEGSRIHQSGIAAVPRRQFRVRVLHTPHHRLPVHREPEQQLYITSSHSGAPHQQPQRAVVEFQWMVRVNAFERASEREREKTEIRKQEGENCSDFFKVSPWNMDWGKAGRPLRSIKRQMHGQEKERIHWV